MTDQLRMKASHLHYHLRMVRDLQEHSDVLAAELTRADARLQAARRLADTASAELLRFVAEIEPDK